MRSRRNKARSQGAFDRLEDRQVLSLVLSPVNISAPVQGEFSGVVATLIDTNLNASPSDFNNSPGSVNVDWGDGQTSSGLVVGALLPGVFEVDASHVYSDAASFSTQITVTAQSGQDAIANGMATVTNEPLQLTIVGNTVGGTAGQPLNNVTVATFLDADPTDTAGDFNSLITWGDGQASIGTVAGANGTFTISGSHTFGAPGTYATNVTLIGLNNGQSAFTSGQAKIGAPPPVYTMKGQQLIEIAGALFSVPVATFTDPNTSDPSSIFTAAVNWGDGQTTTGTITGTNGNFTINGSHLYVSPGNFSIVTTLVDNSNHTTMTTSSALVTPPVLTPVPTTITPSLGQPFTGTVASFIDTNPSDNGSNLAATITWGNGNVTTGTVLPIPGNPLQFNVQGTETYTAAGTFPVSVVIVNPAGQTATAQSTATVATPTIVPTGINFPMIPGQPLANVVIATFTDANPVAIANPSSISAVINWGNGDTSQGIVMPAGPIGTFNVLSGSYAYPSAGASGTFSVSVTLTDPSGQSATSQSIAYVVSTISNENANPFQFTGGLALTGVNGLHASKGYTNTNQPTFSGTAPLFSIVQLYARPFGVDTQIPLGTAVTNGSGQWALTVGPLLAGQYNISAIVTPSGGYPSAMMSLSDNGLVHIDMVPKHLKAMAHPHAFLAKHKIAKLPKPAHHRPAPHKHRS